MRSLRCRQATKTTSSDELQVPVRRNLFSTHGMHCFVQRRSFACAVLVVLAALGNTTVFYKPPFLQVQPEARVVHQPADPSDVPGFVGTEAPTPVVEWEEEGTKEKNVTVIVWDGLDDMESFINGYWEGNVFCETIDELKATDPNVSIVLNITFGCQELFEKSWSGTGNFLGLYYGMRMAAHVYENVQVHFTCHDAEQTRNHLILPWVTGVLPARSSRQPSAFPDLTPRDVCGHCYQQPVGHMINVIQQDMRYMAISLLGRPPTQSFDTSHQPAFIPQLSPSNRTPAPFADIALDDAVLHFRCGDLMDSPHPSFAYMTFRGYTRHILPNATSIGIVTQPFMADAAQARIWDMDVHIRDRCSTVVHSLVDYIQERFPQAQVNIHSEESIALVYARMIFAQQAISGISTFGVMPAVSTFGTGYIRLPDHPVEVNQWILMPRIDQLVDNIILIEDPKRPVEDIKKLWEQEGEQSVLAWFWNDTWEAE